jgi:hypothetical protein
MSEPKITISPKTRVGELLDCYPELEGVLMEMSPAFEKLKNPVLRKTVARVATLSHISVIGGLKIEEVINRLRKEVGEKESDPLNSDLDYFSSTLPDWFNESRIIEVFDASAVINSGGSPLNEILNKTHALKPGEIFELHTPFIPAPILDMLISKGFLIYSIQKNHLVKSYICR